MSNINKILTLIKDIKNNDFEYNDLEQMFLYLISLDNSQIKNYINGKSSIFYYHDSDILLELFELMVMVYEKTEEYEKCNDLMILKRIINKLNIKDNEYIKND